LRDFELNGLVDDAKKGDEYALGKLCEYFYGKVYRFLFYKVNNIEDAEDLTGEVCLKAVKALKHQNGSIEAWIFKIAANVLTDFYRRRNVRKVVENRDDINEKIYDEKNAPDSLLLQRELQQKLAYLTKEQQDVIILRFIEGYETKEIADILKKPVGAIRALQFRALAALKKEYVK
jgi:RNA polymerase sigma-70 factor (ECF subfamily)